MAGEGVQHSREVFAHNYNDIMKWLIPDPLTEA